MWLFLLEPTCEQNLDKLIETLAAVETLPETQVESQTHAETQPHDHRELRPESEGEEENKLAPGEEDVGSESDSSMPSLEDTADIGVDNVTVTQNHPEDLMAGLRRRNRPE